MSQVTKPGAVKRRRGRAAPSKPIYTRGDYRLYEVAGRNHEIRIYNPLTKLDDRTSAGTRDYDAACKALDKLYHGNGFCAHCGQVIANDDAENTDLIVPIINDYLLAHGEEQISGKAIRHRLSHVKRYIGDKPVRVGMVTETWIKEFRKWMVSEPFTSGRWSAEGQPKTRKPSTVEGSVLQLRAAIRFANKIPLFKNKQPSKVAGKVDFRADIPLLAAMFRYALAGEGRVNLLYYLRLAVATWGRPEAIMEASLTPSGKQWVASARVFRLNPETRPQNNKYRAEVPIGALVGAWLDSLPKGPIMPSGLSLATWGRMMKTIKPDVPVGEGGMKLIRRSMATLGKKRLGRTNWIQGKFMGGWEQPHSIADGYAGDDLEILHDDEIMGKALRVTNDIIAEIEALCPGAFQHDLNTVSDNVIAMRA